MFPVLVPGCEGKYESRSCVGDSEAVEQIGSEGWWTPLAKRGNQRGLLDDGTGSELGACVILAVVFVVFGFS